MLLIISREDSVIEPRILRHAGEGLRQSLWRDPDEAIPFVEPVGGDEFLGRAEVEISYPFACRRPQQALEEAYGHRVLFATVGVFHEHLAQRALIVADVPQGDGANHFIAGQRNPKASRACLVETADAQKVGLIFDANIEAELVALDREYKSDDATLQGLRMVHDIDHGRVLYEA